MSTKTGRATVFWSRWNSPDERLKPQNRPPVRHNCTCMAHKSSYETPSDLATDMDRWLANWHFRGLVELCPPSDPTAFGSWSIGFWEIVRIIFKHTPIAAPDCLHAAAAVVAGADMFVSSDAGINKAIERLYNTPAFKSDAGQALGLLATDIALAHGVHNVRAALNIAKSL